MPQIAAHYLIASMAQIPFFLFCEEKFLMACKNFFQTLKPNLQETDQNFEIRVLQKCLRIIFSYLARELLSFS
jgi:hypothetical protein